jgi:hypothetical protein
MAREREKRMRLQSMFLTVACLMFHVAVPATTNKKRGGHGDRGKRGRERRGALAFPFVPHQL